MERMNELSKFIQDIMKDKSHPGCMAVYEDVGFKLISMGGREDSISYEIEQYIRDERKIYTVDIKMKEVSNV